VSDGVWTFAETEEGRLRSVSYELLTRGRELADKLGAELSAVVLGGDVDREDIQELILRGADKVYLAESDSLRYFLVAPYANVLGFLIKSYKPDILIAGATTVGRTLMPYIAIRVNTGLTADCTGLDIEEGTGNLLQTRPAIGGNIWRLSRPRITGLRWLRSGRSLRRLRRAWKGVRGK